MPERVVAAMSGGSEGSATTDWRFSGRPTIASGLGAQTEASAQFGDWESAWATVLWGTATWSSISHAVWGGRSKKPRHTAVPRTGCSWNSRSRAAKMDFIGLNAIHSHPQEQEASW